MATGSCPGSASRTSRAARIPAPWPPAQRTTPRGPELPECWLLAEWPADESEPVQYWLSDLPSGTPLTTLVHLAKLRWRIEHDYREMKQALGLAHFEGRTWAGWHHHVTLVSVAHAFCTLQRLARAPKDGAPA
ncbi:SRSO17 transposase [Streptomyces sp. LBL]|nr:SRSO17 transposase [Streptomyces sp. LBL]